MSKLHSPLRLFGCRRQSKQLESQMTTARIVSTTLTVLLIIIELLLLYRVREFFVFCLFYFWDLSVILREPVNVSQ
jgi:hypothetical protein